MDILVFLEDHLRFVERFYNAAAGPFEFTKRKIDGGEEPFVPRYAADGEPEYLAEWMEADQCLDVLGQCALGLLEKALHDYLREFIMREREVVKAETLLLDKGNWFKKCCAFLTENTRFEWARCPVSYAQIEQINLSRNDFFHDPLIGSVWPSQSEDHFRKYPVSAFADKLHLAVMMEEGGKPERPTALKVTRENLTVHIEYVRQFCTFVEAQRS